MPVVRSYYKNILSAILLFMAGGLPAYGQVSNSYFMAEQLMQKGDYEKAYELFKELHTENPDTYLFFEKATECLVNLKQYAKAIELAEESDAGKRYPAQGAIRVGEIYHIKGDTTQAYAIWDEVLTANSGNIQVYLTMARTLSNRRSFDRAIRVYEQAKTMYPDNSGPFSGSSVVRMELANTHMQAGNYEKAVREYLRLVEEHPDRISHVQSTLLRFNDEYLYDIAILEINEFLEELPADNPSHQSLHQLEVWLLLERELYERALVTAKNYEERQSHISYSLYGLGTKLLSERKFELAEQAFAFYVNRDNELARQHSMEELANVYMEWADYLSDYNLAHHSRRDSLYNKAYTTLKKLSAEAPYYQNRDRVFVTLTELALDHLHDPSLAIKYLEALKNKADSSYQSQYAYLEGRIKLYQKEYARARIAFTKSNKLERIGPLAEKTRYYLALTDFYAGDYEFAKIQLNALERQNTSYFANDAVQLRVWIQEGLQADSTGEIIAPFARAMEHFSQNENEQAIRALTPLLQAKAYHPLADKALLELSTHSEPGSVYFVYSHISDYLQSYGLYSPLRERLMWEKARIADQVVNNRIELTVAGKVQNSDTLTAENKSFRGFSRNDSSGQIPVPESKEQLIALYEDLLMEYPQGFYAAFARNRIQELQDPQT